MTDQVGIYSNLPVVSKQAAAQPGTLDALSGFLGRKFHRNAAQAMVAALTMFSGGTKYALATSLVGGSSSGKSFLANFVYDLFAGPFSHKLSRLTTPALFAAGKIHHLLLDETHLNSELRAIIRQLITEGRVDQILGSPTGELRALSIKGPAAVVNIRLSGRQIEFQDSNRVISLQIHEGIEQTQFMSQAAVSAFTADGARRREESEQFHTALQAHCKGLDNALEVIFDTPKLLLPDSYPPHLPRRATHVLNLASTIALFEQDQRQTHCLGVIRGTDDDVHRALLLLCHASASDDRETISERELNVLRILKALQHFAGNRDGLTMDEMLGRINGHEFHEYAAGIVDGPTLARNRQWTRRMLERPLKEGLTDNGLVTSTRCGKVRRWQLTSTGSHYGCRSLYHLMLEAWLQKTACEPRSPDVDPTTTDPEGPQGVQ